MDLKMSQHFRGLTRALRVRSGVYRTIQITNVLVVILVFFFPSVMHFVMSKHSNAQSNADPPRNGSNFLQEPCLIPLTLQTTLFVLVAVVSVILHLGKQSGSSLGAKFHVQGPLSLLYPDLWGGLMVLFGILLWHISTLSHFLPPSLGHRCVEESHNGGGGPLLSPLCQIPQCSNMAPTWIFQLVLHIILIYSWLRRMKGSSNDDLLRTIEQISPFLSSAIGMWIAYQLRARLHLDVQEEEFLPPDVVQWLERVVLMNVMHISVLVLSMDMIYRYPLLWHRLDLLHKFEKDSIKLQTQIFSALIDSPQNVVEKEFHPLSPLRMKLLHTHQTLDSSSVIRQRDTVTDRQDLFRRSSTPIVATRCMHQASGFGTSFEKRSPTDAAHRSCVLRDARGRSCANLSSQTAPEETLPSVPCEEAPLRNPELSSPPLSPVPSSDFTHFGSPSAAPNAQTVPATAINLIPSVPHPSGPRSSRSCSRVLPQYKEVSITTLCCATDSLPQEGPVGLVHPPSGEIAGSVASRSLKSVGPSSVAAMDFQWKRGVLLDRGASGTVFLALNETSAELMAMKVIEFDPTDSSVRAKLKKLQVEIDVLKNYNHPNLVRYITSVREGHRVNIFMEYVPGGNMNTVLRHFGPLREHVVVQYTHQILQGLSYLHAHHILHGDIKSNNIMLGVDGVIKLADFGSSSKIDMSSTSEGYEMRRVVGVDTEDSVLGRDGSNASIAGLGTPLWMAPEILRGNSRYGTASDIWALGCTVMEFLTARYPWAHLGSPMVILRTIAEGGCIPTPALDAQNQENADRWKNNFTSVNHHHHDEEPQLCFPKWPPLPESLLHSSENFGISRQCVAFLNACLQWDPAQRPTATQLLDHEFFYYDPSVSSVPDATDSDCFLVHSRAQTPSSLQSEASTPRHHAHKADPSALSSAVPSPILVPSMDGPSLLMRELDSHRRRGDSPDDESHVSIHETSEFLHSSSNSSQGTYTSRRPLDATHSWDGSHGPDVTNGIELVVKKRTRTSYSSMVLAARDEMGGDSVKPFCAGVDSNPLPFFDESHTSSLPRRLSYRNDGHHRFHDSSPELRQRGVTLPCLSNSQRRRDDGAGSPFSNQWDCPHGAPQRDAVAQFLVRDVSQKIVQSGFHDDVRVSSSLDTWCDHGSPIVHVSSTSPHSGVSSPSSSCFPAREGGSEAGGRGIRCRNEKCPQSPKSSEIQRILN